jgi:hypothetical protein
MLVRDDLLSATAALAGYIHFYLTLWNYRDKFLTLCSDDVTKEPSICIQNINQRFNGQFDSTEFSAVEDEKIRARFKKVDLHHGRLRASSSLPNLGKSQMKKIFGTCAG